MKTIQKGFTLIELMIVVAIIAILAAIAINQYQDYVCIRAQLAEASSLADGVKSLMGEFYQNHGSFPPTNSSAFIAIAGSVKGQYVQSLDVGVASGQVQVKMGNKSSPGLTNKTLIFSAITSAGSITWHCISPDLPQHWCSSTCVCHG